MNGLLAYFSPRGQPPENKADNLEPVIPAFPMGMHNSHFLGIKTGGTSSLAIVKELVDDPDELLVILQKTYPGLPAKYLEDMLIDVLVAADKLQLDGIFRAFVSEDQAALQNFSDETELITLWDDRPASKYM